jgi:hypothetical protein
MSEQNEAKPADQSVTGQVPGHPVPDRPHLASLKQSPPVYANASLVDLGHADISIAYSSTFSDNSNFPGVRIVLTHENFMRNMEMLFPYYNLLKLIYGEHRPTLPAVDSEQYQQALEQIRRNAEQNNK